MRPANYDQGAALWELHCRRCRSDLKYFAHHAIKYDNPANALSACHLLLLDKLQKVATGEIRNLLVFMPSGSGKSTLLSRIFPAWVMSQKPGSKVLLAAHNAEFAEGLSRQVQDLVIGFKDELDAQPTTNNVKKWHLSNKSLFKSAGVTAGIYGERATLGIIDDPFGDWEDAQSSAICEKIYNWYRGPFVSRLVPNAGKIIMHQRLSLSDLAARLLEEEPDNWEKLFLPAIFDGVGWDGESVETDELGRKIGDSVWPEYFTDQFLEEKQRDTTPMAWASQYQQRPIPIGGQLLHPNSISIVTSPSPAERYVRGWDLAASVGRGDWTVGVLMQRNANGSFTILDVERFQATAGEIEDRLKQVAARDAEKYGTVVQSIPQDGGASGKIAAQALSRALSGYLIHVSPDSGSKESRARPFAAQVDLQNVSMMSADWNGVLKDEFVAFPSGRHDDIVDAASRAFASCAENAKVYRAPSWGHMPHMSR